MTDFSPQVSTALDIAGLGEFSLDQGAMFSEAARWTAMAQGLEHARANLGTAVDSAATQHRGPAAEQLNTRWQGSQGQPGQAAELDSAARAVHAVAYAFTLVGMLIAAAKVLMLMTALSSRAAGGGLLLGSMRRRGLSEVLDGFGATAARVVNPAFRRAGSLFEEIRGGMGGRALAPAGMPGRAMPWAKPTGNKPPVAMQVNKKDDDVPDWLGAMRDHDAALKRQEEAAAEERKKAIQDELDEIQRRDGK